MICLHVHKLKYKHRPSGGDTVAGPPRQLVLDTRPHSIPPFSIPIGGIRLGNAYRRKLMKPKRKNGGCLALVRRLRWANQHGGDRFPLGA